MPKSFPFQHQLDQMDCGPTCLFMISKHYGKTIPMPILRSRCYTSKQGSSLLDLSEAAETLGFRTFNAKLSFKSLEENVTPPFIVFWRQQHFLIVYKIDKKFVYVADPAYGKLKYTKAEFKEGWEIRENQKEPFGIILVIEPSLDFYKQADIESDKLSLTGFLSYVKPFRKYIIQIFIGLFVNLALSFIFPFLTQSIVDIGINTANLTFINIILAAQLTLFISTTIIGNIRAWLFLHMGTKISISILSDFIIKIMKLPMSFFDNRRKGDILQRIRDNSRIQSFLTTSAIDIVFGSLNFLVFSIILCYYNLSIFVIFIIGSVLYFLWVSLFMKKRKALDYKTFEQNSDNQSSVIELIDGAQEIKLQNCAIQKRWQWERIQLKQFKLSIKSLSLSQFQQAGAFAIDQTKNILITYFSAKAVVDGQISFGMMLSIQYIIGQLNGPVGQAIGFMLSYQDARISLERIQEIHSLEEEEDNIDNPSILSSPNLQDRNITLTNATFHYAGPNSAKVLKNINITIPVGKTTAIVGFSGSGKTTLLKILLKFYNISSGEIKVGEHNFANIQSKYWRSHCGAVLQDGFLFSDTIAKNVSVAEDFIDQERLSFAFKMANLTEFLDSLPLGYNTKIGDNGQGVSQGQKQRILLARAFYNNPQFLFFDEATNSLDSQNEKVIMNNIYSFFKKKTVVIVAHRLSTIKNADQIIVLADGEVIEVGNHNDLTKNEGMYYSLVKEQLSLK